jgi:hypothetical protein
MLRPLGARLLLKGPAHSHGVSFNNPQTLIEIIDTKVELEGEDPFGQVSGDFIRLRCYLLRGRLNNYRVTALDIITLDTVEPLGCLVFFPDVNLKLGPQDLELYCVTVTYKETPDGVRAYTCSQRSISPSQDYAQCLYETSRDLEKHRVSWDNRV